MSEIKFDFGEGINEFLAGFSHDKFKGTKMDVNARCDTCGNPWGFYSHSLCTRFKLLKIEHDELVDLKLRVHELENPKDCCEESDEDIATIRLSVDDAKALDDILLMLERESGFGMWTAEHKLALENTRHQLNNEE